MARAVVFIAAVLAHIALLILFAMAHPEQQATEVDERRLTIVFLADAPPEQFAEPVLAPTGSKSRLRSAPPLPASSAAITTPAQPERAPPPRIDWSNEAQLAAAREINARESERRQSQGFSPAEQDRHSMTAAPAPRPEFGWDRSHTNRIEPLATGGTLIHLNDRCAIAFAVMIIPVCKLGKIEARGDLFDHMNDTPRLAD